MNEGCGHDASGPDADSLVRQLIAGVDTEDIVVYDASDCQLYGKKHYRRLTGELEHAAEAAGCRPEVYQSIYWWTLVYFPVKPLGTYLVLFRRECDDPDGDADQYRAVKLPMDRGQVRGGVCSRVFSRALPDLWIDVRCGRLEGDKIAVWCG